MGLKMKNVNIMGVHQFLGEGGGRSQKNIKEELPKKGGLNNLQGAVQKIGGMVFLMGGGGGYPDAPDDLILVDTGT